MFITTPWRMSNYWIHSDKFNDFVDFYLSLPLSLYLPISLYLYICIYIHPYDEGSGKTDKLYLFLPVIQGNLISEVIFVWNATNKRVLQKEDS